MPSGLAHAAPPHRTIAAVGKPPRMPTDIIGFRSTTLRSLPQATQSTTTEVGRSRSGCSADAPGTTPGATIATALGP